MRDPKRLFQDDPHSVGARLLRGGRTDAPNRKRVDRIVAGLVGAGGALATAKAGAASLSLWSIAQWFAAGAIGGVVATSALFALERPAHPVASAPATVAVAPSAVPAPSETHVRVANPPAASAEVSEVPRPVRRVLPSTAPNASARAPSGATTAPAESTLGAEAAALAAAKGALDRHAPAEALAALRGYRARFAHGELAQDATYLEMEAELASGNATAARAIATTLATGASPSAERARQVLKGEGP